MNKNNIVIKIGGSLLFNKNKDLNTQKIADFCDIIRKNEKFDSIVIVVGGGIIARQYINFIRKFTRNEALADLLGIHVSRINAKLLISYLDDIAYPIVPKSFEDFSIANLTNKIIVIGGLQPGQSTTSVALEIGEYIRAREIIILTDVKGIYNKDPKKYENAKLLEKLSYSQLSKIIFQKTDMAQASAGEYRIFDAVSLQILRRSNLKVQIGSGKDLSKFKEFWLGDIENIGTIISD